MSRESFEKYELKILRRDRYDSDEEHKSNVLRWFAYWQPTLEAIDLKLQDPRYAEVHEYLKIYREEELRRTDGKKMKERL
ncbi:MAG: hypothetical protein WCD86_18150 [Ktedonobacteraceae bacterium]